ncbi:GIY-YIG nuclease family protein [Ornithinimicrobium sufpigmenti]|uniref:GIY-YIG nuclease family protein n=1 Tax=Ornithinimicrobium sufpigmenti TaxID=2508882 RepID=UPI001035898F|nr:MULTISPECIES: GIY-YIG nuclease family protein [unclassified Ornithinimicrobium]
MRRTHYVYRAYDEHGLLLYVGCTGSPRQRHDHHRSQSAWFPYAVRFVTAGPYAADEAFALEAEVIERESPFFNTSRAEVGVKVQRHAFVRRHLQDRRRTDPSLWEDFERFCSVHREAQAEAERRYPTVDHHASYLQARNRLDRVAAEAAA